MKDKEDKENENNIGKSKDQILRDVLKAELKNQIKPDLFKKQ
jgi:hypothetical protein